MSAVPPPSSLTLEGFKAALEIYPLVAGKVYRSKIKDAKKVNEALERDQWRFEELPTTVATARLGKTQKATKDVNGAGLSKEAVERLVQWKITHGHSRPFLPGMVRKNEASAIIKQTTLAFEKLGTSSSSSAPSTTTLTGALELVCKLNGIGPATGTLVLNIFDPAHIPFFQDEMFLWFFPNLKGGKLKYSQKEYIQLYEAVGPILKRLKVQAVELEKVAYVLHHKELLGDGEKAELEKTMESTSNDGLEELNTESVQTEVKSDAPESKANTTGTVISKAKKGMKRPIEELDEHDKPATKGRSQRKKK